MRHALVLSVLSFAAISGAQDTAAPIAVPRDPTTNHTVAAAKMATAPTIDGTVNDDEWKDASNFEGMVDAQDGSPAPEKNVFWLGYDEKYIYFAARLHDSQPGAIKCTEYRSNVTLQGGDDTVQLDIDPYGALTDWSHFTINPKGATQIQIAGGRAAKREWIGDFVAKARITPDGWEAEARIPWALMKLPGSGARDIRFDFDRYMARTSRYYDFTNVVGGSLAGVGKWQQVDLPKIEEDRILQLLPYTYQGVDQHGGVANGGLDLKMPVTNQMTLVGTVNPDFRNIENQILSIDFSRFERLANESRPFFQEGSQYYGSALIATQRVKDFDSGLNIYGKVNNQIAMGLLNTSNFGEENDLMTTWQYSPNVLSNFRFSHTNLSTPSLKNQGYLLAYSDQLSKTTNVFLRGMSSQDTALGSGQEQTAQFNYQKDEIQGSAGYETMTPNFMPRLGFVPEVDFKGFTTFAMWDHVVKRGNLAEVAVDSFTTNYSHFGGGNYRREAGGDLAFAMKDGFRIAGNADFSQFEGSDDHTYTVNIQKPRHEPYRNWVAAYTWGRIEDAAYSSIAIGSAYRPVDKLQLSLSTQFVHHVTNDRQLILGGTYDLGNDRAISGRVVESGNDLNAYVALQRSGGAGIEYFLILGDPNANKFRRSLILKVTYPLQMFLGHHGK